MADDEGIDQAPIEDLTEFMKHEIRVDRWIDRIVRAIEVMLAAAILVIVTLSLNEITTTANTIQAQTSPKAAAANRQFLKNTIAEIVLCTTNHEDRFIAETLHRPMPTLRPGCPGILKAAADQRIAHVD